MAWLREGADNYVFLVAGEWVFRFPKRAERVVWQAREDAVASGEADLSRQLGWVDRAFEAAR